MAEIRKPGFFGRNQERRTSSRLVGLGTCGLHTLHNCFQHGEKASGSELKLLLNAMHKIFDKSPARRADYEKIKTAIESDYVLEFCSHRWTENARVAESAENVWEKYLQIIEFWKICQKGINQVKASLELRRVMILC